MAAVLSTSFAQPATASASVWTLASVTGVEKGHVCQVESELAQVLRVGPGLTLTVQRGIEGTATAAHATSTPVVVSVAGDVQTGAPVPASPVVTLRQATVTISDTQIKTLPSTGVPIVPAPGVNRLLVPVGGTAITAFAVGYTADAEATWAFYFSSILASSMTKAAGVLGSTDVQVLPIGGAPLSTTDGGPLAFETFGMVVWGSGPHLASPGINTALVFADFMAGGPNYTGGHASNTLTVSVLYSVLDVTTGVFV